jgi:hypothetical protein
MFWSRLCKRQFHSSARPCSTVCLVHQLRMLGPVFGARYVHGMFGACMLGPVFVIPVLCDTCVTMRQISAAGVMWSLQVMVQGPVRLLARIDSLVT